MELYEFVFYSRELLCGVIYDTTFSESVWKKVFSHLTDAKHYKAYESRYKVYIHQDTTYEHLYEKEKLANVFKTTLINRLDPIRVQSEPMHTLFAISQEAMNLHQFNWSTEMNDIYYLTRIVVKITPQFIVRLDAKIYHSDPQPVYSISAIYTPHTDPQERKSIEDEPVVLQTIESIQKIIRSVVAPDAML